MGIITKNKMDLAQKKAIEVALANDEKNKATIDYIAMMCDVDIPTEEDVENVPEN